MNATRTITITIGALALTGLAAACGTTRAPAAYAAPTAPVVTATPAAPAPASTTTTTPQASPAQIQALETALGYLSDGQGFSEAGLLHQLHSPYGNGYSMRLARWAVGKVSNAQMWRHQAVISARGYMSDGQGFSYDSLVQQLDSPYGSQFTYAQAVYAAHKVGL